MNPYFTELVYKLNLHNMLYSSVIYNKIIIIPIRQLYILIIRHNKYKSICKNLQKGSILLIIFKFFFLL